MYEGPQKSEFILRNNKKITIDKNMLFWKRWFEKGVYFVQDLHNEEAKFLSFQDFQRKFEFKC